jgi:hypothetical protein
MVTVVVLTVTCVVGEDVLAEDVGAADALGEAEAEVEAEVGPPENLGWRNSIHESRYSTLSPSDTSSMVGDTA